MKFIRRAVVIGILLCIIVVYFILSKNDFEFPNDYSSILWTKPIKLIVSHNPTKANSIFSSSTIKLNDTQVHNSVYSDVGMRYSPIVLVTVACQNRLNESLIMLKSAAILTSVPFRFIVFADEVLMPQFITQLDDLPADVKNKVGYEVLPITFPNGSAEEWRKLFKPCSSQRLFLPDLLPHIDSVIYVDTDVLFLLPLENLWQHFYHMNSSQMAALTPEHEDFATGWYNRFARHPYYGPLGVNSGVMLMNLTRMRSFGWREYFVPIYEKYKLKITWGDQDIINIIFHYHPDKLYIYPCRYNYRPDHCMYNSVCESAEESGVAVLHGNRGSFHNDKQPAFKAVYRAVEEYEWHKHTKNNYLDSMEEYLRSATSTNCGKVYRLFLKEIRKHILV